MAKPSVMTIRVPNDLKHKIELLADEQGLSINQLALYMFTKELATMEATKKLSNYWLNHSKNDILQGFDKVISKIKPRKTPKWDTFSENA